MMTLEIENAPKYKRWFSPKITIGFAPPFICLTDDEGKHRHNSHGPQYIAEGIIS
jgi:hypothetical protein